MISGQMTGLDPRPIHIASYHFVIMQAYTFYGLAADRQEYCFTTDFF